MYRIEAAVLRGERELAVEEVSLDEPGPNEVLVDVQATGVCHTDYRQYAGPANVSYPAVLGHEGAGVVEAVGQEVDSVQPGDHVVMWVLSPCGDCPPCERGEPYFCEVDADVVFGGTMMDGTRRLHGDNGPLNHFFTQSSFATKAVVPARTAIPIPPDISFDAAALLGCGASTGIGSVLNAASMDAGASAVVFGCGGVGCSALLGADAIGASPLIAVDVVDWKLASAMEMGATHSVNPEQTDPIEEIRDITDGGVDYAFECIGNPTVMEQAIEATRTGGTAVLVGGGSGEEKVAFNPRGNLLPGGKTIQGSVGGFVQPQIDIPRFAEMYANGDLNLDLLISEHYELAELSQAFEDMEDGNVLRGVVVFE